MKFKLKPPARGGITLTVLPSVIITTVILLVIFEMKGIFPFGSDSVAYMDMWQMNVPIYYHIYDVLHGDKSIFYDFYTALGMNMAESVAICSLLSPFNILFYLTPRDSIVEFLPIFTLLKLNFSVISMGIFLRYRFKNTHNFWRTLASVAYGLCGMNMMYCTNSQWLDMSALFPLLMLCLDYSMRNKKILPYSLMLGFYFIVNPYLAIITLLFIFFGASMDIVLLAPKKEKALRIFHLGIGTALGAGMSAFIMLPFVQQMNKTSRTSFGADIVNTIKNILDGKNPFGTGTEIQKYWMMWGTALASAIIIYGIILNRKQIKRNIGTLICIAVVVLQIFFENIHLIWHGGSYALFPMRFGFITSFVMWTLAMSYVNNIPEINVFQTLTSLFQNKLKAVIKIICALGGIVAIPFASYFIAHNLLGIGSENIKWFSLGIFGVLTLSYFVFINRRVRNVFRIIVCTLLIAEVSAGAYLFIGEPYLDPSFQSHPDMQFAEKIIDTGEAFETSDSVLSRVKNSDGSFTSNYPFIMEKPALSNWTHSIDTELQHSYKNLGYSIVYTRLVDTGGTVFLDALMNVEDVFTAEELPAKSYTFENSHTIKDDTKTLNHYKTNYHFGAGTVMSDIILSTPKNADSFTAQNATYSAMGGEGSLFHIIQYDNDTDTSVITEKTTVDKTVKYTINITGCQNLYLAGIKNISIKINGEPFEIYAAGNKTTTYPQSFNNGIIDLGVYENETINMEITYSDKVDEAFFRLILMDYAKLDSVSSDENLVSAIVTKENGNGFELEAVGKDRKNLLLIPISYDEGISCKVNGKKVETEEVFGCFTAVRIANGKNTIKVSFTPSGFGIGAIISVASLGILMAYHFLFLKKKEPTFRRTVRTIAVWEFAKFWILLLVIIYLIPMIYQIVGMIKK